ncbi:MAG: lipoate--protein ligase [Clostridia bacterium]|nr:lipoate--protein ligase [Clostridia bacterium]
MRSFCVISDGYDPRENLALEQYITENCAPDEIWLYLWQNRNTVVIGRNQNPWRECDVKAIKDDGVTLVRRESGGGAVFHDEGNLNFTFIADNKLYDLERQLGVVIRALESFGLRAEFSGRNDILLNGKKFSGNAFSHKVGVSLQHGTLLISSDMARLAKYLKPSKAKLEAKGVQSVRSRVCNLADHAQGITKEALMRALLEAFEAEYKRVDAVVHSDQLDKNDYKDLIDKYSSWEWTVGETPQYKSVFENRFGWGEVQLCLDVKNGAVVRADLFSDAMDARTITEAAKKIPGARARGEDIARAIIEGVEQTDSEDSRQMINELCLWIKGIM